MPTFHRNSANPAGYAAFPSGYDFINNPALNSLPGAPAPFDAIKGGGPNAGTYFFGFGDDIITSFINRPANALADNCDTLDNYLRRPIAVPSVTGTHTAGISGDTAALLPASPAVYLGTSGQDAISETVSTLFRVVDVNGDPLINQSNGSPILVASITSTSGGDAIGIGFAAGTITVHFNFTIPAGTVYQIYYGLKSNLAFMPPDSLLLSVQRDELEWFLTDFVLQVSNPGHLPGDVTALVSTHFRTPNGVRLPESAAMSFDVDPEGSGAVVQLFQWTSLADVGGARVLAKLYNDPTSIFGQGATGLLQLSPGFAWDALGTALFRDVNIAGGGPGGDIVNFLPLSSSTAANGDQFIRVLNALPTAAVPGSYPESILQSLNARFEATVGDGVNTFGDFNGPSGLQDAVNFFAASTQGVGHIKVKSGNSYTWTSVNLTGKTALYIEGSGSTSTSITSLNVSGPAFQLNFQLVMKGISWVQSPGTSPVGFLVLGGCVFLEDVVLEGLFIEVSNAQSLFFPAVLGVCFYAKNCVFLSTAIATPGVIFDAEDGNTHAGYILEDCTFNATVPEAKTVVIGTASPTAGTVISGVRFIRCTYVLAGSLVTAGVHANNTGVLEIAPQGSQDFTIADITFQDCDVSVVGGAGYASILAYIMPLGYGATGLTQAAILKKVTIRGGKWDAGSAPSDLGNLFICAQKIVVEDVDFYGTNGPGAGVAPPEAKWAIFASSTPIPQNIWSKFTFSVGRASSLNVGAGRVFQADLGIDITNARFSNLTQCNTCDLRVDLPGTYVGEGTVSVSSRIQNVKFFNYLPATSPGGSVPLYRFYINSLFRAAGDNNVHAVVDQVSLLGLTAGESTNWSANGLVGIEPTVGLELRKVTVQDFFPAAGSPDNGFFVNYGAGLDQYKIRFIDCMATSCNNGLIVPAGSGSNNPLDGFEIIGGDYSNNQLGIALFPDKIGAVTLHRVRACYNVLQGLSVAPGQWDLIPFAAGNSSSFLTVTSGTFVGNNPSSGPPPVQVLLRTRSSGDKVYGYVHGNICRSTGASPGAIEVQQGAAGALPSPAILGVDTFVRGVETGWGGSPQVTYANNIPMLHNHATLITP